MSIGKKPGANSSGGTGSVDNLFLASMNTTSSNGAMHNLVSPFSDDLLNPQRRVSAPVIKYQSARSPSPSSLTNSVRTSSPKSPTNSNNSVCLSPLSEEGSVSGLSDNQEVKQEEENRVQIRTNRSSRRTSDERAVRHSMMISRSLEDLSNLADEEDGMAKAMHQDTFQMGLMSLRTPVE